MTVHSHFQVQRGGTRGDCGVSHTLGQWWPFTNFKSERWSGGICGRVLPLPHVVIKGHVHLQSQGVYRGLLWHISSETMEDHPHFQDQGINKRQRWNRPLNPREMSDHTTFKSERWTGNDYTPPPRGPKNAPQTDVILPIKDFKDRTIRRGKDQKTNLSCPKRTSKNK